jgi:hypothetical protein
MEEKCVLIDAFVHKNVMKKEAEIYQKYSYDIPYKHFNIQLQKNAFLGTVYIMKKIVTLHLV